MILCRKIIFVVAGQNIQKKSNPVEVAFWLDKTAVVSSCAGTLLVKDQSRAL